MRSFSSKCVFLVLLFVSMTFLPALTGAQQISFNPSPLGFGNVNVGGSKTQSVVVKNITKRKIGIFQASVSGAGYTISGISCPIAVPAGQSMSFNVTFAPTVAAPASGTVSLVTQNWWKDRRETPLTSVLNLSGSGAAGGEIAASPASVAFGTVMVGDSKSSAASVINTGSAAVTISQAAMSNAAFTASGLNPPITLTPGQSLTFNLIFTPVSAGATSGNLAILSDASNSQLNVAVSGSGATPGQLALAPATYDFGNVNTGTSVSTSGTLHAAGSSITLFSASGSSPEFVLSGVTFPVTLADGQTIPFTVTFLPQMSGLASGSISFVSNAANSPVTETLQGTGIAPAQHSIDLSWNASGTPDVVGYNVYRGAVSGGPYGKITPSPDPSLTFSDADVKSGQTYYYVVTAQDSGGVESKYSGEAAVTVPNP